MLVFVQYRGYPLKCPRVRGYPLTRMLFRGFSEGSDSRGSEPTRVQTPAGLRCPQEAVQWVPILMWASVRGALVVVWGAFLLTFQHKGAGSVYDLIGGDLGPLEGESENHPY